MKEQKVFIRFAEILATILVVMPIPIHGNDKRSVNALSYMAAMIVFCCGLFFYSPVYAAESSQKISPTVIPSPSREFIRDVLSEAFPDNITQGYHTYILIKILPSFHPESQIMIGLKAGEQHAQASLRQANISMIDAFRAGKQRNSDDPKIVANLMGIQQKDITIPVDIVLKWISDYWVNIEAAIRQMRDKANVLTLDGTRYIIEVHALQNKITLNIIGSDIIRSGRQSGTYGNVDIAAMLDWIAPIIEYVKD